MSGLTLPLRTGQKCVTRDGLHVEIGEDLGRGGITVIPNPADRATYAVRAHDGRLHSSGEHYWDIVADQIDTPQPLRKGHPHAASMALYAQDAAEHAEPWTLWERKRYSEWKPCTGSPAWRVDVAYRRKPRTININGHEVPEPLRVAPPKDEDYWIPDVGCSGLINVYQWHDHWTGQELLQRGLIHATRDAAEAHARALLSFTEVK